MFGIGIMELILIVVVASIWAFLIYLVYKFISNIYKRMKRLESRLSNKEKSEK